MINHYHINEFVSHLFEINIDPFFFIFRIKSKRSNVIALKRRGRTSFNFIFFP